MAPRVSHSFPSFDAAVAKAAERSLREAGFSPMEVSRMAEARLGAFAGWPYARLTANGFGALQAGLLALGARPGRTVVLPTVTCPSVYHAAKSTGAEIVVADVGADLPLLPVPLESHRIPRGAIVVLPQMFGLWRSPGPLAEAGFLVIDDSAQCLRPSIEPAADLAVLSFSPTKFLTVGFAGAVLARSEEAWSAVQRALDADHLSAPQDQGGEGMPFRVHSALAEFQAAMLLAQLDRYEDALEARSAWVRKYDEALGHPERLQPKVPYRYQILCPAGNSEALAERLQREGIDAKPLGSHLLHRTLNVPGPFPNADRWRGSVLSLPLHENLSEEDVIRTAQVLGRHR